MLSFGLLIGTVGAWGLASPVSAACPFLSHNTTPRPDFQLAASGVFVTAMHGNYLSVRGYSITSKVSAGNQSVQTSVTSCSGFNCPTTNSSVTATRYLDVQATSPSNGYLVIESQYHRVSGGSQYDTECRAAL